MLELLQTVIEHEFFRKFCTALIILVVGILAIRIVGNILKKALEKSRLEKAAHTLITSLAKTALYILLGVVAILLGLGSSIASKYLIDAVTGHTLLQLKHAAVYPATHYATPREAIDRAIENIEADLDKRIAEFKQEGNLLEAQRLAQRTNYDIEMLRELKAKTA